MGSNQRAQAALDMLISYGVAILVISVAIYIIVQLGVFNSRLAQSYCNPAPSLICDQIAINDSGAVIVVFTQGTGGTMNITGASCSTLANATTYGPKYGNFFTLPYGSQPSYYPTNALSHGLIVYSSNTTRLTVNCYGPGGLSTGSLGGTYSGFIWINYTYTDLPSNYHAVQQVFSFTTKYT